jgi:hypothetical protein
MLASSSVVVVVVVDVHIAMGCPLLATLISWDELVIHPTLKTHE